MTKRRKKKAESWKRKDEKEKRINNICWLREMTLLVWWVNKIFGYEKCRYQLWVRLFYFNCWFKEQNNSYLKRLFKVKSVYSFIYKKYKPGVFKFIWFVWIQPYLIHTSLGPTVKRHKSKKQSDRRNRYWNRALRYRTYHEQL